MTMIMKKIKLSLRDQDEWNKKQKSGHDEDGRAHCFDRSGEHCRVNDRAEECHY